AGAERAVEKARKALLDRSAASAKADGRGVPETAAELMNRRLRPHPRRFPVAIPYEPVVHLRWPPLHEPALVEALDRIATRVARLGHSSSLVSMRVRTDPVELGERSRWVPSQNGGRYLRVAFPGQLQRLRE